MKLYYKALLLSSVIITNFACAPSPRGFQVKTTDAQNSTAKKEEKRKTTGHTAISKDSSTNEYRIIKYTPSGNLDRFEELAEEERVAEHHSASFAQSIEAAYISQQIVEQKHQFEIKIKFIDVTELITFKYELDYKDILNKYVSTTEQTTAEGDNYRVSAKCEATECKILKLTLFKIRDNDVTAQASILYTVATTKVRAVVAESENDSTEKNPLIEKIKQQQQAVKETFVVVDGKSGSTVSLLDPNDPTKPLLKINTPVAQTYDNPVEVESVTGDGVLSDGVLSAKLQGSNALSGELALDVTFKSNSPDIESAVRLYLDNKENKEQGTTDAENFIDKYITPIFPLIAEKTQKSQIPTTLTATKRLEIYRDHDTTKKYINMWTQKNNPRVGFCNTKTYYSNHRATKFLTQMSTKVNGTQKSLGQITSRILNKIDTIPQMAYLVALEGNYWTDFNSNIVTKYNTKAGEKLKSNEKRYMYWSDAAGPYGCLTDTCRSIIKRNQQLLEQAGLNLQVSYVTKMERDMYDELVSQGEKNIKRGNIRRKIFNSGKEAQYKTQRTNGTDLVNTDARKYFATATLLAGLEVRRLLFEKKNFDKMGAQNLPKKLNFEWKIRKDPALAILAYHSGFGNLAKYAVCTQLESKTERDNCKKNLSIKQANSKRHQGFETTFDDISKYGMAPCNQLDYTWAWLSLQFIGADPTGYGIEIGNPGSDGLVYEELMPYGNQLSSIYDGQGPVRTL